jgi:hypothetical protein
MRSKLARDSHKITLVPAARAARISCCGHGGMLESKYGSREKVHTCDISPVR